MRKNKIVLVFTVCLFALTSLSLKVEATAKVTPAAQAKEGPAVPKKAVKDMTKADVTEEIKRILGREEEIINLIPGFKMERDDKGNIYYTYNGVRLEKLDKGELDKILGRTKNEAVRIRSERLNQQLETIRRAQQLNAGVQQAARPPTVPVPPPPQPPRVPQPPQTVNQPPKTPPAPPPAPPKR